MIWRKLKEFVNQLDENQLNEKVILWREEDVINDISARQLEDDHYINDGEGDQGCFTLEDAQLTEEDIEEEGLKKVYDKGFPLLEADFKLTSH